MVASMPLRCTLLLMLALGFVADILDVWSLQTLSSFSSASSSPQSVLQYPFLSRLNFDVQLAAGVFMPDLNPPPANSVLTDPFGDAVSSVQLVSSDGKNESVAGSVYSAVRQFRISTDFVILPFSAPIAVPVNAVNGVNSVYINGNDAGITGSLALAYPDPSGCSPLGSSTVDGQSWQGKIVLAINDSSCSNPNQISDNVQAAGGAGLLLANSLSSPTNFLTSPFVFSGWQPCTIPFWTLRSYDAQFLSAILQQNNASGGILSSILVSMPGAGPLAATEWPAYASVLAALPSAMINISGVLNSSTALSQNADPCVQAVLGFMCRGWPQGHIFRYTNLYPISGYLPSTLGNLTQLESIFISSFSFNSAVGFTLATNLAQLSNLRVLSISNVGLSGVFPMELCAMTSLQVLQLNSVQITSVPACLNSLPALQRLVVSSAQLAAFPTTWSIAPLVVLSISGGALAPYPVQLSFSGYPSGQCILRFLLLSGNKLSSPLPVLSSCPLLYVVDLSANHFSSLPSSPSAFDGLTQLMSLSLAANIMYGALPNLLSCSALQTVDVSRNQFSGDVPLSWLQLSSVKSVNAGTNRLTTSLQSFHSMSGIAQWNFSGNHIQVNNSIQLWNAIPVNAQVVDFSASKLGLTFLNQSAFTAFSQLRYLSLSGNFIQCYDSNFLSVLPSLSVLDLSSNQLQSGCPFPTVLASMPLSMLILNNNPQFAPSRPSSTTSAAVLPPPLALSASAGYSKFSASQSYYCPMITTTQMPKLVVQIDAAYYGYAGCICEPGNYNTPPNCAAVPPVFTIVANSSQADSESGSPPLSSFVFAGMPAAQVPVSTSFGGANVLFSDAALGATNRMAAGMAFTIALYGSPALTGLNSSAFQTGSGGYRYHGGGWPYASVDHSEINYNGGGTGGSSQSNYSTPTPVYVNGSTPLTLTITFAFNLSLFKDATDILVIYEGGPTLQGTKLTTFTGTSLQAFITGSTGTYSGTGYRGYGYGGYSGSNWWSSTNLVSMGNMDAGLPDVLSLEVFMPVPIASIEFQSRKQSGQLFEFNFTTGYLCPNTSFEVQYVASMGFFQCIYTPTASPMYTVSSALPILVYCISAVVFVLILAVLFLVVWKRRTIVIRTASMPFCVVILLFLLVLNSAAIPFAMDPVSDSICQSRAWLLGLGIIGVLSAALTKAARILRIFNNKTFNDISYITNKELAMFMAMQTSVQLALLIAYSAVPLTYPTQMQYQTSSYRPEYLNVCASLDSNGNSSLAWLIVQFIYIGAFLLYGAWVAYGLKSVPTAFNESSHLAASLAILFFVTAILVPLNFIVNTPEALIVIRSLGVNTLSSIILFALFGNKLVLIFTGRENDDTIVQTPMAATQLKRKAGLSEVPGAHSSTDNWQAGAVPVAELLALVEVVRSSSNRFSADSVVDALLDKVRATSQTMVHAQSKAKISGRDPKSSNASLLLLPTRGQGSAREIKEDGSQPSPTMGATSSPRLPLRPLSARDRSSQATTMLDSDRRRRLSGVELSSARERDKEKDSGRDRDEQLTERDTAPMPEVLSQSSCVGKDDGSKDGDFAGKSVLSTQRRGLEAQNSSMVFQSNLLQGHTIQEGDERASHDRNTQEAQRLSAVQAEKNTANQSGVPPLLKGTPSAAYKIPSTGQAIAKKSESDCGIALPSRGSAVLPPGGAATHHTEQSSSRTRHWI